MIVFAINNGSSSLKLKIFQVNNFENPALIVKAEAKNRDGACTLMVNEVTTNFENWSNRFDVVLQNVQNLGLAIEEADAIIHRVVHGLEERRNIIQLDQKYLDTLEKNSRQIAPLHNPYALEIIKKIQTKTSNLSNQYICFDTTFGMTIPEINYLYALPKYLNQKYPVRKYLFHGLSHKYVINKFYDTYSEEKSKNIVSLHLGSGSSVCTIIGTQVVDTSFGFSPLENLISSTRIGEFDIDAYNYIKESEELSDREMLEILHKKSGLLGLSDLSSDMKILIENYHTNANCKLAVDMYVMTVVKYIYHALINLSSFDVLIFTGGIGQAAPFIREAICKKLELFGLKIDANLNSNKDPKKHIFKISQNISKIDTFVIDTDEEFQMINEFLSSQYFVK